MCFSSFQFFYEDKNKYSNYESAAKYWKKTFTTQDIIKDNFIGNFSSCVYRSSIIKKFPKELFDIYIVDWMFNIYCSLFGKLGFINTIFSVYRKHNKATWNKLEGKEQIQMLLNLIDTYDEFLNYKYSKQFKKKKRDLQNKLAYYKDLIIFDTVFPHTLSAFRFEEFVNYLEEFDNSLILTTGQHLLALKEFRSIRKIIDIFVKLNPKFKNKVFPLDILKGDIGYYNADLAYLIFLDNLKTFFPIIEQLQIPFVFTLYPGGGFRINDPDSDFYLRKYLSSPLFEKVIVTQKITLDYLLDNNFCDENQIKYIFGVVTPLPLKNSLKNKLHYGIDKKDLDICFVAHKYMDKGIDKGYDVFVEVAEKLVRMFDNISFHVVGSFSVEDIELSDSLLKKINFYGLQNKDWFNIFYQDKDIILSPNKPFVLLEGSFDGFPTASCTDAGVREVAIFCTDLLDLNDGYYNNHEEIVIIPYDIEKIIDEIEYYYFNPIDLAKICKNGAKKIRQLYGYESQMRPRINLIENIKNKNEVR